MTDMPGDVAALEAEFPAWDFGVRWQAAGNGPDARRLLAWARGAGRLATLSAADAEGLREAIRAAGG